MFKTFRGKIALSGIVVLGIGVALLVFTFISAYGFLTQSLSIASSEDFVQTFGAALAPLIATCIRLMYLGVMVWVGSLLTIRGVTLLVHASKVEVAVPAKVAAPAQPQRLQQKAATEPEFVIIPPEQKVEKADSPQP